MNKAEDLALEKYPSRSALVVPARGGGYYADSHLREGFIEGYHQAEKDLELGWEDIRDILKIYDAFTWKKEWVKQKTLADGYQEILKRFKDLKNGTTSK